MIAHCYYTMTRLFQWMEIDSKSLLYGLDHLEIVMNTSKNFL